MFCDENKENEQPIQPPEETTEEENEKIAQGEGEGTSEEADD